MDEHCPLGTVRDRHDVPERNDVVQPESHAGLMGQQHECLRPLERTTDAVSGIDGYSFEYGPSPSTEPDLSKGAEEQVNGYVTGPLSAPTVYFHLRAVDDAGNWSDTLHIGPFLLDPNAPTNPTPQSLSHIVNRPSPVKTIRVGWGGATDDRSGVDGFPTSGPAKPAPSPIRARTPRKAPQGRRARRSRSAAGGSTSGLATTRETGTALPASARSSSEGRLPARRHSPRRSWSAQRAVDQSSKSQVRKHRKTWGQARPLPEEAQAPLAPELCGGVRLPPHGQRRRSSAYGLEP